MKRRILFSALFSAIGSLAIAQNVGIGTTTPLYDLHITKPSGNVYVWTNSNDAGALISHTLSAGGFLSDFSRWGSSATGTVSGINVAGLTRVWASGGGLLLGTGGSSGPVYFSTNNAERMRITTDGQLLMNTTTPLSSYTYALQVNSSGRNGALFLENPITTASETVSIGRGVPATRFTRTTPLHVIAANDRAIVAEGDNFEAIEATSGSSTYAAGYFNGSGTAKLSVELDGFIKVSGGNRTAFVHTATTANTTGHITRLSYTNPLQSDIVMVTPNYNPIGGPAAYNSHPIGVYWNGSTWTIFNQDIAAITGTSYNVMVIRQ